MSAATHFSVTTAGALVLGGIAAFVLATVIAFRDPEPRSGDVTPERSSQAAAGDSAAPAPAASGDRGTAEVEYPLDTSN